MNTSRFRFIRAFQNLSVSRKILAITILSSLATLSLLCSISFYREWTSFSERKEEELITLSRILESNTVASLRFNDPRVAQEYASSLQHQKDVEHVIIYDNEGNVFAAYQRSPDDSHQTPPEYLGAKRTANSLSYVRRVYLNGSPIGTILIEMSLDSVHKSGRDSLITAISLLLSGLAITTLMAIRMQRLITEPVSELVNVTKFVARKKDFSHRANKRYSDEIGSLVDSFNAMLEAISKRDHSLLEINSNLEKTVEERTIDLQNRNNSLKEAMDAATAASIAKSNFLATMSHELRTPMNAITGMASLLNESDINQECREFVDTINLSSDTLLSLINDLLDYSKIESGKLELEEAPFDLLPILEDSLDIASTLKANSDTLCVLYCDPKLPSKIVGDSTRLKQVLMNLINNAVKFTESGSVTVRANYVADQSEPSMSISVIDTGIGIPADKIDHLFELFSQVDSSTTRQYGGTGLGLTISNKLMLAMGGKIEVESEFEKGSTFTVHLPIAIASDSQAILQKNPNSAYRDFTVSGIEEPIRSSIVEALEHCTSMTHSSREGELVFVSAISDTAESAIKTAQRFATSAQRAKKTVLVCHKAHLTELSQKMAYKTLPLPVKLSDLNALTHPEFTVESIARNNFQHNGTAVNSTPLSILLAEDHRVNQKVFRTIMKREGYSVSVANNGQEAVDMSQESNYDIIFMDLHMPVMDGEEATKLIREKQSQDGQPWIIGFSANAQVELVNRVLASGMDDFLAKPVRTLELREALNRYRARNS